MWSNLSAKRKRLKETIGCKGTGFRSILGWAKTISIDSGDLHISFSDEYAQECLKNLYSDNLELIKDIKAPTLVFPKIVNDYIKTKYTTNITIEIKDEDDAKKDIEDQLNTLDAKILLFLNRIETLIIEIENKEIKYIKVLEDDKVTIKTLINNKEETSKTWYLKSTSGEINEKNYSISIAYSKEDKNENNNVLYSFFPTDVDFPYSVILHATFELNSDRNHLIKKSDVNKVLLKRSFELLVELALEIYTEPNYDALSFVINNRDFCDELVDYNCAGLLKEVIVNNKLFPNVNDEMLMFDEEVLAFYESEFSKYLSGEYFNDLLKYTNNKKVSDYIINSLFTKFEGKYTKKYVIEAINEWVKTLKPNDTTIKRVAHTLVCSINENLQTTYTYSDGEGKRHDIYLKAYFDQDRNLISCENELFLNQNEKLKITKIPAFANISLLDYKFSQYLLQERKNTDDLLENLHISDFSLNNIINSMNDKIEIIYRYKKDPSKAKEYAKQELEWLWKNKKRIDKTDIGEGILILNLEGNLVKSNELYYGKKYGNPIIDKLLEPKSIVANITKIIDTKDASQEDIIKFLDLLGIAKYPRIIPKRIYYYRFWITNDNHDGIQYVKQLFNQLSYPKRIEDVSKSYKNKEELFRDTNSLSVDDSTINELDYILDNAKTKDILDWILLDDELKEILFSKITLKNVSVQIDISGKQKTRILDGINKPISNIYWKFYSKKWISKGENRYSLSECFEYDDKEVNLFPYLCYPKGEDYVTNSKNKDDLIKKYNEIFEKLEINENFSKLSTDLIYKILKALPTIENSEKIAKSFYLNLIKSNLKDYDEDIKFNGSYRDFIENGEVLSNNGYKKISDVYYAEEITIPKQLNEKYNLICLGSRKNSKKIENFLGVKKLKFKSQIIGKPKLHSLNEYFTKDFYKYKVLAYCYRIDKNKEDSKRLNRLNVFLCSYIKAKFNDDEVTLQDFEYMQNGSKYYVKIPDEYTKEKLFYTKFSNLISEIMCDCLKLTDDSSLNKSFRELYSKGNDIERKALIHQDIEDELIIENAMKIMDARDLVKDSFVSLLEKISKKSLKEYYTNIDQIDFENFNGEANAPIFIELFKKLKIDIEQYNDKEPDKSIDITNYYKDKIEGIKSKYKDIYKSTLYLSLINSNINAKSNFETQLNEYETFNLQIKNSVDFNYEKEFIEKYDIKVDAGVINFADLYSNNKNVFVGKLEDTEYLDDFLNNNNDNLSLLYFEEYDVLKEKYDRLNNDKKKIDVITQKDFKPIKEITNIQKVPIKKSEIKISQRKENKDIGFKKRNTTKQEEIGLIGERYVYDNLIKRDDISNVRWVSENAQKANVNPEGRAGLGHDIEYLDADGTLKYIEVKTTSNQDDEIKFYMSNNEYEFAIKNYKNYSVYYVVLKSNDDSKVIILNDVFNENGFNSDNYGINANEYTIMAQISNSDMNDEVE